jgi:iron complex outermembrane recepter protein
LNTRYDSFPNAGGTGVDATGNQLPYSPRWTLYSEAAYRLPMKIRGSARIGADFSYETSYFSDVLDRPQNLIRPQGYADAFVSYRTPDGHWTTSLTGNKLGDRRDFQSLSFAGSYNSWEGPVSPPLTVFLKVAYVL